MELPHLLSAKLFKIFSSALFSMNNFIFHMKHKNQTALQYRTFLTH